MDPKCKDKALLCHWEKKNTTTIVYIISDHTVGLSASRMVLTLAVMETLAHPSDK